MNLSGTNKKNNIFFAVFFAALVIVMVFGSTFAYAEEAPADVEENPVVEEKAVDNVAADTDVDEPEAPSAEIAEAKAEELAALERKAEAEEQIAAQQKAAEEARKQAEAEVEKQQQAIEEQKAKAEAEKKAAEEERARKQAEEEARKQAEETQRRFEESLTASGMSDSDFNALCKIVEAEDGHDCIEGRIGIANVILNRVRSPFHPNSIMGVLTAPGQFGPVRNGAFAAAVPSASTIAAVKEAVAGKNTVGSALYFHRGSSWGGRTLVASVGAHGFFV